MVPEVDKSLESETPNTFNSKFGGTLQPTINFQYFDKNFQMLSDDDIMEDDLINI